MKISPKFLVQLSRKMKMQAIVWKFDHTDVASSALGFRNPRALQHSLTGAFAMRILSKRHSSPNAQQRQSIQ